MAELITDERGPVGAEALFARGRRRGLDPVNSADSGPARTTVNSFWVVQGRRTCDVCRHTFRVGEMVFVENLDVDSARIRHHSRQLPCSGSIDTDEATDDERAARFFAAVDKLDPLTERRIAIRLRPGHPLLADLRMRCRCAGCGHTLRPFEMVVLCPCDVANPKCRLAVHHDPSRGANCYQNWWQTDNADLMPQHCPMSYRKLVRS